MTVINQNNYKVVINYSPELICLLKQFFTAAEQRNQNLKALVENLQNEKETQNHLLLRQLVNHSEEKEVDIELVKKLLP
jgi:hypothetical protein